MMRLLASREANMDESSSLIENARIGLVEACAQLRAVGEVELVDELQHALTHVRAAQLDMRDRLGARPPAEAWRGDDIDWDDD